MYFPTIKKTQTSNIFKISNPIFFPSHPVSRRHVVDRHVGAAAGTRSQRRGATWEIRAIQTVWSWDLDFFNPKNQPLTLEALSGWMNLNEVLYFVGVFVGPQNDPDVCHFWGWNRILREGKCFSILPCKSPFCTTIWDKYVWNFFQASGPSEPKEMGSGCILSWSWATIFGRRERWFFSKRWWLDEGIPPQNGLT